MVLGIRFPKTFEFGQSVGTGGAANNPLLPMQSVNATAWMPANNGGGIIPIAPARYSQVRKVVFWCNARMETVSTTARLRIAIMPTVAGTKTAFEVDIQPSSVSRWQGTGDVFPAIVFDAGDVFDKVGPTTSAALPVSSDVLDGAATMMRVEFDRFQGDSADFFTVWDSVSNLDHYLAFRFVIERRDGSNWADSSTLGQLANMACTIVQAPSSNNRSVTIMGITSAPVTSGTMATAFPNGYRAANFRFVASEWDNITAVHILGNAFWQNGNARDWRMGLYKLDAFNPIARTQLYTEDFSDNASARSTGDRVWWRSADVKAFVQQDGAFFHVLFDNLNAGAISQSTAWIEIIQEGFTNTVCHHPAGAQRDDLGSTGLFGAPGTGLFDPTWYQSFPDDLILGRRLYLGYRGDVADSVVQLNIDASLQSNVTGLEGTSASLAAIQPDLDGGAGVGSESQFPVSFTPDPINLAGVRRLVWGIRDPNAGDFQGDSGIYYVLAVPISEIPEVGNVFPVDAFDPEGCASTAAGLGDPGVLVITNGATVPKKFNPTAGNIEDAGVPEPFCNETLPTATPDDTAASPNGGLGIGIYRYRYTFRNCCTGKESNPNDEDIVVDTAGASPAAEVTINFTGVRIPGDPQICEICLYRTIVDGAFPIMAKVGCFDPSVQSTFLDQASDEALDFENEALSTLNAPPPCTPIVVELRNRLVFMGDVPMLSPSGTVTAEEGSDIITGDFEVEWDRCLEGKYIQLEGDCRGYEILCVMPPELGTSPPIARLQLVEPYEGESNTGTLYKICGHQNRLWFSEPFEPEYVPESSFMDVDPGDGDRIMGAVANFDSLLICKRRKTYVLRWRDNPVLEVSCPTLVSTDIGCIAPRSYAQVESGSVWLADRGLAIYDGRSVAMVPESVDFDVFFTDPDNPNYVRRDLLGRAIGAVGVYYPKRKQYLLLLPTVQTNRGANLLMVWDTVLRNVTVHTFCQQFTSMTVGKDGEGNQRVYVGDANGFVWILDIGGTDGVGTPGQEGTISGTITAAGLDATLGASFIEDDTASFITGGLPGLAGLSGIVGLSGAFNGDDLGLAGVCVYFRPHGSPPETAWDSKTIYAATATRLFVTGPFTSFDAGITGYDYMIGPIDWRAEFKPSDYGEDDTLKRPWRQVIVHEVEDVSSIVRVELRPDFQFSDDDAEAIQDEEGNTGQGRLFDMSFIRGRQVAPVGRILYNFQQVILTNFAPNQPVRLLNHLLGIDPHASK